jgi:tight adherence protein C
MNTLLLAVFVAIALFAASALVIFVAAGERSPTETRLAELAASPGAGDEVSFRYRVGDLISVISTPLAPLRNWLRSSDEELAYRLSIAGYRRPQDVETYLSAKLLAPVVGVLLATLTGTENPFFYSLILGAAAFFAPDVLLFYAIGRRKARLNLSLPDATDLLVICMEAGLGMDQAVLRVAEELKSVCPELSEELLTISREQRAGKPRAEAWRSMAHRVDLDAVRQFVAMLVQAEKLGTPVARALGQFADSLRIKRLMTAEENAAKTSVKLVFPLVFFIFPAIFVVLLGPAAITLMQSFEQTAK